MTTGIIITLCLLILTSYVFDLSAAKTRIPSVILLLFLGWLLSQLARYFSLNIPDLSEALPVLGTIGLILIVLEGSLELELNRNKSPLVLKSLLIAIVPMLLMAVGLAFAMQYFGYPDLKRNLVNAIPLSVISSAIAIPSARSLSRQNREFITYESSLSDIFGVLLFNFIALNDRFSFQTFGNFFLQLLIIIVISFVATAGLAFLLSRIGHHIKFVPIILLIILIYSISKIYHLPGLIFILIFGLFLGNLGVLKRFQWIQRLNPDILDKEVHKLRDLNGEGAFLIRSLFFLLFGFLINANELLNADTFIWAASISAGIFILRAFMLGITRLPFAPLLFIAPRGLITILLFLSIEPHDSIGLISNSLIIQVIVLTALFMMLGMIFSKPARD